MATPKAKPPVPAGKANLPVSWEDQMKAAAAAAVEQEASVATGSFLSFKAGQISYGGNTVPGNKLDVIVVDGILENCYYGRKYNPDDPSPPICYAYGRDDKQMRPHEKATDQQATTCAECEHNKFGSAEEGGGKACKNTRRLALLPAEPLNAEALGKADFAFAKLPVTSVKNWASYVRQIAALRQRPPMGVITTIGTVPDTKTQFKVTFEHKADVPSALGGVIVQRLEDAREALMMPYPEPEERFEQPARPPARGAKPAGKRKY